MNALALDLGSRCGWALLQDGALTYGVWDLRRLGYESRLVALREQLSSSLQPLRGHLGHGGVYSAPGIVCWEQPIPMLRRRAAGAVYHLEAVALLVATELRVPHLSVPQATMRKVVAGSGRADKDALRRAAVATWDVDPVEQDACDALCVLAWLVRSVVACSQCRGRGALPGQPGLCQECQGGGWVDA